MTWPWQRRKAAQVAEALETGKVFRSCSDCAHMGAFHHRCWRQVTIKRDVVTGSTRRHYEDLWCSAQRDGSCGESAKFWVPSRSWWRPTWNLIPETIQLFTALLAGVILAITVVSGFIFLLGTL